MYRGRVAASPEEQRLAGLMAALASRGEYATGAVRFPDEVKPADGAAIAADLQVAVDRFVELRAERAAADGAEIACAPGCTSCCEQLVGVWAGEAELVAAWLREPAHADARAAFAAAYPGWHAATRASIDRVVRARAAADAHGQDLALAAHWRARALCAFNHDGLCSVYEVRPTVCRTCHALATSADCVPDDATGSAAVFMHFVPLERLLARARPLAQAVHHALGGARETPAVLCDAVAARLGLGV